MLIDAFVWIAERHYWTATVPLVLYLLVHAKSPLLNGQRVYMVGFLMLLGVAGGALTWASLEGPGDHRIVRFIHGAAIVLGYTLLAVSAWKMERGIHRRACVATQISDRIRKVDMEAARDVERMLRSIGIYGRDERIP